jgi:general stress protein YciG
MATNTRLRGFASMDPEKQRAIASKGGSSVPAAKRPFAQNHELAASAGRKGGERSHGGRSAAARTDAANQAPAADEAT